MTHKTGGCIPALVAIGISETDANALRRISMTLHRWHELECGDGNDHGSWCITRGHKTKRVHGRDPETQASTWTGGEFTHDDDGAPFLEHHHYLHGHGKNYVTYTPMADKERGAQRRLAQIMARYPTLSAYIQGDPRGCALYILRPGDVPAGEDASAYYNRGVAVYK